VRRPPTASIRGSGPISTTLQLLGRGPGGPRWLCRMRRSGRPRFFRGRGSFRATTLVGGSGCEYIREALIRSRLRDARGRRPSVDSRSGRSCRTRSQPPPGQRKGRSRRHLHLPVGYRHCSACARAGRIGECSHCASSWRVGHSSSNPSCNASCLPGTESLLGSDSLAEGKRSNADPSE
jgi:hypothetical protein